jgi:hypothetical protein
VTIRYVRDGLRIVRVQTVADETLLSEVEELRDTATLLEVKARSTRRRAQTLVATLLDDHRRRRALATHRPPSRRLVTGDQLRRARALAGKSQRQLAAEWGYSRGAIAGYEGDSQRRGVPDGLAGWVRRVLGDAGELEDDA